MPFYNCTFTAKINLKGIPMSSNILTLKKHRPLLAILPLLLLTGLMLYASPADKVLGKFVKLVYLHASLIWATLLLFFAAIIFMIIGMFFNRTVLLEKGKRLFITGTCAWGANLCLSILSMLVIWGAIAWQEPRFKNMVTTLFILVIGIAIAYMIKSLKAKSSVYIISSIIVFYFWLSSTDLIHPPNAISNSPSFIIKLFTVGMTACFFIVGLLISEVTK